MATKTSLKIKTESLPERCEVCHQADHFDPVSGHCSRCHSVQSVIPKMDQPLESSKPAFSVSLVQGNAALPLNPWRTALSCCAIATFISLLKFSIGLPTLFFALVGLSIGLSIFEGRHAHIGFGALIGSIGGLLSGLLLSASYGNLIFRFLTSYYLYDIFFTLLGAILGAVIGLCWYLKLVAPREN